MSTEDKLLKRRLEENHLYEVIDNHIELKRLPLKKQKELKRKVRVSRVEYTFLQYGHLIRKWATANHDITLSNLDVLIYVSPLGVFTNQQFRDCQNDLSMSDDGMLRRLEKKGWIVRWSKVGKIHYNVLSTKGNNLIRRMHRMYMLEEVVPMSTRKNRIANKKDRKSKKLMELFTEFNKKVRDESN
tara:strand:+ start:20228 stop:20785 length:558 start_codon:yes stop_codon:yes gene_type:complete